MQLALTTLVKNRAWILPDFLACVRALRPDTAIFIDDCSHDDSYPLLYNFAESAPFPVVVQRRASAFDTNTSSRDARDRQRLFGHLATLRNALIALVPPGYAQLSIDSDILFPPTIAETLASYQEPYAAAMIYNTQTLFLSHFTDDRYLCGRICNMASYDADHDHFTHITRYPLYATQRADQSGACYLASPAVLATSARYAAHRFGEDAGYALALRQQGITPLVDTTPRCVHVLQPHHLESAKATFARLMEGSSV